MNSKPRWTTCIKHQRITVGVKFLSWRSGPQVNQKWEFENTEAIQIAWRCTICRALRVIPCCPITHRTGDWSRKRNQQNCSLNFLDTNAIWRKPFLHELFKCKFFVNPRTAFSQIPIQAFPATCRLCSAPMAHLLAYPWGFPKTPQFFMPGPVSTNFRYAETQGSWSDKCPSNLLQVRW